MWWWGSIKLQKYSSFAQSWSTIEEYKNVDVVVPDQLLTANTDVVSYHIKEYKNSGLVGILNCLNSFQHNNYVAFSLLYILLRENRKINAVCFPSFHGGCNPAYKLWCRLWTGPVVNMFDVEINCHCFSWYSFFFI